MGTSLSLCVFKLICVCLCVGGGGGGGGAVVCWLQL